MERYPLNWPPTKPRTRAPSASAEDFTNLTDAKNMALAALEDARMTFTSIAGFVLLAYVVALFARVWLRIRRTRKRIAAMLEPRRPNYSTDMQRIMGKAVRDWDEAEVHRKWRTTRYRK